jgi:outer membrane protein OmpA-like peptidoglycan-associated protein
MGANIESLGGFFEQPFTPSATQARLVIYQTREENLAGATGVFVEGGYHASLVAGAWSHLCYSPGTIKLAARQMQVGKQAKDLMDSITAFDLVGGQTHYLRIYQENGRPVLKPVSLSQALREIEGSRQQMHTISRVAQVCLQSPDVAQAPQKAAEITTRTAHVLFEFDRSDAQAMTRASLELMDATLLQLRSEPMRVERVHVIGHADPLGKPEQNERLSQERAHSVRDYLQNRLPDGVRVTGYSGAT